jgi:hypothetical protein
VTSWDRRSGPAASRAVDLALRTQVRDNLAPFSPYWREVVRGAGLAATDINGVADLPTVPAVGERDLCPTGNPRDAARLVLQADEAGWAVHSSGPALRRALRRRLLSPRRYREQLQDATRPLAYHLGGLDLPIPIASTRDDLDVIARAGARAWRVLGLDAVDALVSFFPPGETGSVPAALGYAALGAGAPALHASDEDEAAHAIAALSASVVAVRSAQDLLALGPLPDSVRLVLFTGDDPAERERVRHAADRNVRRLWGPPDGRWAYAECAEAGADGGLHTYPDLEILETIDPATSTPATAGELVLTQLGVRGSALLRWRTGAVHSGLRTEPCPGCGRTVPRIGSDLCGGALVPWTVAGTERVRFDLRVAAAALSARTDLAGWRIELSPDPDGGPPSSVLRIALGATAGDPADIAFDVAALTGAAPGLLVLDPTLPAVSADRRAIEL